MRGFLGALAVWFLVGWVIPFIFILGLVGFIAWGVVLYSNHEEAKRVAARNAHDAAQWRLHQQVRNQEGQGYGGPGTGGGSGAGPGPAQSHPALGAGPRPPLEAEHWNRDYEQ